MPPLFSWSRSAIRRKPSHDSLSTQSESLGSSPLPRSPPGSVAFRAGTHQPVQGHARAPDFNKETPPLRRRLPGESNCPRRLQRPIGRPHSLRQRPAPAPTERQLRLKPHPASPKRQDPRPPGTPSTPPPSGRPAATIHPEALCLRGSALPTPGWTFSPRPAPPNRVPANHRPARPLSPAKPEAPARNPSPYLDDEDLSTLAALLCSPRESMSPEPPSASPQTTRFSQRPHPFHS